MSVSVSPAAPPRRRFALDLARPSRRHILGYVLLAPAVLLMAAFLLYPLFVAADISFQNVNIVSYTRIGSSGTRRSR